MTNLNGNISYSIEIELDSDTLTEIKTVEERDVFGGRTVMDRPARTVEYLTLSPAQIQLLDVWVKILATVIEQVRSLHDHRREGVRHFRTECRLGIQN